MMQRSADREYPLSGYLFPEPGAGLDGPGGRGLLSAAAVFFLAILVGTLLVDIASPLDLPTLAGAEHERDEERRHEATWRNGTTARILEDDLRLRSRVRESLSSPYTLALYHYFGEAQGSVLVGRSGWLFFDGRAILPALDDGVLAGRISSLLAAVDRRMSDLGVRLVVAPIPRKSVFSREYLPPGIDPRPAVDRLFVENLQARGVDTVDLLSFFESTLGPHFYKADTHWSHRAEYLAAREITRAAGLLIPESARQGELRARSRRPGGDLLRFIGIEGRWRDLEQNRQTPVEIWEVFENDRLVRHTNPRSMTSVALVGTSFSQRGMAGLLSYFAQQTVYDGVRPGTHSVDSLRQLLVQHRDALPEIVLFEIPNHHAFLGSPSAKEGELFASFQPTETRPLGLSDALDLGAGFEKQMIVDGNRRRLLTLRPGALLHSGDGVVEVELRGTVEGAIEIEIATADYRYRAPWQAGVETLSLPLLDAGPSTALDVTVSSSEPASSLHLHGAQLVTTATRELAVGRESEAAARERPHNCRDLVFEMPDGMPRHGVLWLKALTGSGSSSAKVSVEVTAEGTDRSLRLSTTTRSLPATVVNVGSLTGSRTLAARVCGPGVTSGGLTLDTRLLGMHHSE